MGIEPSGTPGGLFDTFTSPGMAGVRVEIFNARNDRVKTDTRTKRVSCEKKIMYGDWYGSGALGPEWD